MGFAGSDGDTPRCPPADGPRLSRPAVPVNGTPVIPVEVLAAWAALGRVGAVDAVRAGRHLLWSAIRRELALTQHHPADTPRLRVLVAPTDADPQELR